MAEPIEPGPILGTIDQAEAESFDVVVIGGGVYGITTLLEASRRSLRALLIERDDFGGGVSWASHRIIHGGLRYLQSLDLPRFAESVRERRWFLETFPHHVEPLPCLVPLDNRGTRRRSLFACAAMLNNTLNACLGGSTARLSGAGVIGRPDIEGVAPGVPIGNARSAGEWTDGLMVSSERLLVCLLRMACTLGGRALSRTTIQRVTHDVQAGLLLECVGPEGRGFEIRTRRVVNCAGPSSPEVAAMLGGPAGGLFEPMRAFNVLLDVPTKLSSAVALRSQAADGRMLFIVPGPAGLAVGTWEEPHDGHASPPRESVERLLDEANRVLGRSDLEFERVVAVWSGLLPRGQGNELAPADRPVVLDHGTHGGCPGAISVSGVKFTTARLVASRLLQRIAPDAKPAAPLRPIGDPVLRAEEFASPPEGASVAERVTRMIREEAAATVDDVCRRRSSWYAKPAALREVAAGIGEAFGMSEPDARREVEASIAGARLVRE